MAFSKRFRDARHPEYPDAVFRILANPTGTLYDALLLGDASTEERAAQLGVALMEVYGAGKVEAYGVAFDFSSGAQALATIQAADTPVDMRRWLRNAPIELVDYERAENAKNWKASFDPGK